MQLIEPSGFIVTLSLGVPPEADQVSGVRKANGQILNPYMKLHL
jgi:hypothetical protein